MSNVDVDLEDEEVALTGAQSVEDFDVEEYTRPKSTKRRVTGSRIPQKWQSVLTIVGVAVVLTAIVATLYISLRPNSPNKPPQVPGTPRSDDYEEPERPTLEELFMATGGSNWTRKDNWMTDAPICEWFGVWCNFGQIRSLSLQRNNLRGTIPASIGNLTTLGQLNLPYNHIEGSIPKEIAGLKELRVLILLQNNLTGVLPLEELASLKLQSIDVGKNQLTGEISEEFINSVELGMSLAHNNFYGTIPDLRSETINTLFLSDNQFAGTLPKLPSTITRLLIEHNRLIGDTHELLSLRSIQRLNIAGNNFTGEFMLDEDQFGQLKYLNIADNAFTSVRAINVTLSPGFECHASNTNFACPLPSWLEQCSATCT